MRYSGYDLRQLSLACSFGHKELYCTSIFLRPLRSAFDMESNGLEIIECIPSSNFCLSPQPCLRYVEAFQSKANHTNVRISSGIGTTIS
jgi:hypothetical protein